MPASATGGTWPSKDLANGVLAPNKAAASSAYTMPWRMPAAGWDVLFIRLLIASLRWTKRHCSCTHAPFSLYIDAYDFSPAFRRRFLDLYLSAGRRRRGAADRSGLRAGAARPGAAAGTGPAPAGHAGHACARRPRHRRLAFAGKLRQPHRARRSG